MKKSRFTDEQVVAALRDAEATTVVEAARKHGVSEQTFYRWRKQYAGMAVSDVRELRRLQDENARLKKLLAERALEVEVMREIQAKKSGKPVVETDGGIVFGGSGSKPAAFLVVVLNPSFRIVVSVTPGRPRPPPIGSFSHCCALGPELGLSAYVWMFAASRLAS